MKSPRRSGLFFFGFANLKYLLYCNRKSEGMAGIADLKKCHDLATKGDNIKEICKVVDISSVACQELGKVLHDETHKGKQLFVSFMGFGCSGPVLGLALDEPDETCSSFESNGISVFMHPALVEHLEPLGGVIIDYIDNGPEQHGFTITTKIKPESSCGGGCESHACGDGDPH